MTNRENAHIIEARSRALEWETGSKSPANGLVRCRDCFHSSSLPSDMEMKERVYCITYDAIKRCDGFCELGTIRPKEEKEN